jgi:transposase
MRLREMLLQETKLIRQLSRSEPFAEPLRLIISVPGIGITTGISFVTEIDDITRFGNSYQLASYVGLIPM